MTIYVLATLEDHSVLSELINTFVDKSIKFTVSKDIRSLCSKCSMSPSSCSAAPPAPPSIPPVSSSSCCAPKIPPPCNLSCAEKEQNEMRLVKEEEEGEEEEEEKDEEEVEVGEQGSSSSHQMECDGQIVTFDGLPSSEIEPSSSYSSENLSNLGVFRRKANSNNPRGFSRQCQVCEQWITSKNIRAHAGTHIALIRLRCSCCQKTFARMHRGVQHLKQVHPDEPLAKIVSAVTQDQQRELDEMMTKCFPPACYCGDRCYCKH